MSKCSVMIFPHARTSIQYEYKVRDTPVQRVSQVRDLGVYLTYDLRFCEYIYERQPTESSVLC